MLRGCKVNQRAAALLAVCLASGPVHAGTCSNPAGHEADIKYNGDYHVLQFCNGTNWINAGFIASPDTVIGGGELGDATVESNDDNSNGNLLLAQEAALSHTATVQSLSFYVTTATGNLILGIYDATGPSGGPGARLATTAGFAPTTGWNTANVVTPVALAAGNYWVAYNPSSDGLHFVNNGGASGNCAYYSHTYGALPGTFSTAPTSCTPTLWSLYATVTPGCGSPNGKEGDLIYNAAYHTWQFCNGANWVPMELANGGGGGGGCSSPAGKEAALIYNAAYHTYQFCNGTNWIPFGGPSWITPPGAGNGYFVMSKSTWNGNLGDLSGADSLCLTELTTNTGWKGYAEAEADGKLVSGNVHAWLCDNLGCNNLNANTTYYFADANNSTHGGNLFTTTSSGDGPGFVADWSQPSYFASGYEYWAGTRANGAFGAQSPNSWGTTIWTTGGMCNGATEGWGSASGSNGGCFGLAGGTGVGGSSNVYVAEYGGYDACGNNNPLACNTTHNLICYVNP